MRIAIVVVDGGRSRAVAEAEGHYALALGHALAGRDCEPWLLCNPASPLSTLPVPLPRFCVTPDKFLDFFRLWQWQRGVGEMLVLAVGEDSLRVARRLYKFGPRGRRAFGCVFLLSVPARERRGLLGEARLCICGSSFLARELKESNPEARIREAAPGIDVGAYAVSRPWQEGERFIFGMNGSLAPHSGALLVVRAMAALWQHDDLPPWEVRMFGSGPRFDEIMTEAEKLGVLPRLAILGDQPPGRVTGLCHVWISPGTGDNEMPWVLWGGFAARMPVICSQSPLHRERVRNRRAVVAIESDNPQEMARAMLNTMRDAALRESLVAAAESLLPAIDLPGMGARLADLVGEIAWLKAPVGK